MKKLTIVLDQWNKIFRLAYQDKKTMLYLAEQIEKKCDLQVSTIKHDLSFYNQGKIKEIPQFWCVIISKELNCNEFYLIGTTDVPYQDYGIWHNYYCNGALIGEIKEQLIKQNKL